MKQQEISIADICELPSVASTILQFAKGCKVFTFYADMGAGKTTLIKELCKQLGSHDNFSSPTYSIVNEYTVPTGKIYHMDCYRLKNAGEALDIGLEDYLNGDNYCFIEWPELIEHFLPADVIKISIRTEGNIRNVSIFKDW